MSSDPGSSTASIHDTLLELYPQLVHVARRIASGTSLDSDDLLQHVMLKYIEHTQRHGPSDNPKAYLTTMMGNRRNRLLRARQRERLKSIADSEEELDDEHRRAQERLDEAQEALGELEDLRALLDKIRWHPASSRAKVHLWAVFLLSLRVVPTERGLRASGTFTPDVLDDLITPLEHIMPWHDDEQSLRLSVGFDVLVAIWEACKAHARTTASMSFCAIVEAINAHHDTEALSIDQWNQWRSRTRQAIRQRCAEEGVDYEADLADIFNP